MSFNQLGNKEWVVFKSDKSGRLTVDSVENYSKELKKHTEADKVISREDLKNEEENFNRNLKCINSIFGVGVEHGDRNVERVNNASISTNVEPPVLRGQRKDQKVIPPGGVTPMRALCGGTEAPNARLGHGVGMILTDFLDGDTDHHEMKSSEEMRSKFHEYNTNVPPELKKRAVVNSMDAKSLYPSIKKSVAKEAIIELIDKSDLDVKNIDYWEAAKYIYILCTAEKIHEAGLADVIPRRTTKATRKLTLNCLFTRGDSDKWILGKEPDSSQKKKMIALVLCAANDEIMSNHVYKVGDDLYKQSDDAPAGSEYAGIIARAVTRMFDKRYLQKTAEQGLNHVWKIY